MPLELTHKGMELGILVRDAEAALRFYRDFLGLRLLGELDPPGGHMVRFRCGGNTLKIVVPDEIPDGATLPPGSADLGIRYWTLQIDNFDEVIEDCRREEVPIRVEPRGMEIPGVRFAIIEDPEGNWLELVEVVQPQAT